MFKTILVPVDVAHADSSQAILEVAANNASDDANIVLLNIVEEIPKWAAIELPDNIQEKSVAESNKALKAIADASDQDPEVVVRIGHPYQTILDEAEKRGAELIVIASHKPGLQDYLLGSTAAKVVRHAKCSVLVVR